MVLKILTVRPPKFNFEFQMQAPGLHCVVQVFKDVAYGIIMEVVRKFPAKDTDVPSRSYYLESNPHDRYNTIERLLISVRRDLISVPERTLKQPGAASEQAQTAAQSPGRPTLVSPSRDASSGSRSED